MLNKQEEFDFFEILKNNFPPLHGGSLVIGVTEFLRPDVKLREFICKNQTAQEAALPYILKQQSYLVLDESEGYQCIFLRGHFVKIHYDATQKKILSLAEDFEHQN